MKTASSDMRSYIRHPVDVPIVCKVSETGDRAPRQLNDFSEGGVSFSSDDSLEPGSFVEITIDLVKPVFAARAEVVWCHKEGSRYHVGVAFTDPNVDYKVRMVEQLCHIEQYRQTVFRDEGRRLTTQQAAMEWINRFAGDFPSLPDGD